MNVVGWKAWYTNGRKFDSSQTSWSDLPDDGAILIQLYFDKRGERSRLPYRRVFLGDDYFWHVPPDLWGSCRHAEMTPEEICERYPDAMIKRGKWTSEDEYKTIVDTAHKDRFFQAGNG